MAAVSVFGFDFNLTTGRNTYVTYQSAINLARRYNSEIIFNEERQTPMFTYRDAQGISTKYGSKMPEASDQNSAGLGTRHKGRCFVELGMEDPNIWPMLRNEVVVRKF